MRKKLLAVVLALGLSTGAFADTMIRGSGPTGAAGAAGPTGATGPAGGGGGTGTTSDLVIFTDGAGGVIGNYGGSTCAAGNVASALSAAGVATCVPAGSTNITNVTGGIFVIPNKSSTGTTVNKIAKLDTTASPATAVIATTADTTNVLGLVVSGAGTTGSATILGIGQGPCQFDNTATVGHFVIVSTSVNGDCSDSGSATTLPSSVAVLGIVAESGTTASPRQVDFGTPEVAGTGGTGGKGVSVQVGGTATKAVANFNNTTPVLSGNNTLVTWQSSASANTTSVSAQVDPATFVNLGYSGTLVVTGIANPSSSATVASTTRYERVTAGAGGVTRTLPAATGTGRVIDFVKGDSAAGSVTIARAGSDTINGATTVVLANQYESVTLLDAASGVWDLPIETAGAATNAYAVVGGSTSGLALAATEILSVFKPTRNITLARVSGAVLVAGTCAACGVTDHTFRVTDGSTNSDCTNASTITCTTAAATTFTCTPSNTTRAADQVLKLETVAAGGTCTTEPIIAVNWEYAVN